MADFRKQFHKEIEKIAIPKERLTKAMKAAKGKEKKGLKKPAIYAVTAAILGLSILFGSAFFSPAMASTFAKLPVIGSLFEKEDPIQMISEKLEKKGFQIASVGLQFQPDKIVQISVDGTEQYLQTVQDEIKTIAENALHSEGYDAYTVVVDRIEIDYEELAYQEQYSKDLDKIHQALSAENINKEQIEIRYIDEQKSMEVWIIGTEEYFKSVKDDVKEIVANATKDTVFIYEELEVKHSDEPLVQVISHKELPEAERKWMESRVISFIGMELYGKTDYHVRNVGHKITDGTLHLRIDLDLNSSDSSIEELANGIQENIVAIFESDRFKPHIDGLPYTITFYSKDVVEIK